MIANVHEISFWDEKYVLELVVKTAQPCDYSKNH